MKKSVVAIAIVIVVVITMTSCSYHSEDDLIESTPLPDVVTYQDDVKVIIDSNCLSCHSDPPVNGAPMDLTTFASVKDAVENRNLIERISTQDLSTLMPFGGPRLPQNLIDIVMQWEADGLLEND